MENTNQLLIEWKRQARQMAFDKLKQELTDKQDFQNLEKLKEIEEGIENS